MTDTYRWRVQRGESAGLLCPVTGDGGLPVDPTSWPVLAHVKNEPGGFPVHIFTGTGLSKTAEGVHLSFTATETLAATWRRGWFEVVLTDPNNPTEVSMIVHGLVTVTDS